jgi:hypothetical protein
MPVNKVDAKKLRKRDATIYEKATSIAKLFGVNENVLINLGDITEHDNMRPSQ